MYCIYTLDMYDYQEGFHQLQLAERTMRGDMTRIKSLSVGRSSRAELLQAPFAELF
jgi:hypothetical protein